MMRKVVKIQTAQYAQDVLDTVMISTVDPKSIIGCWVEDFDYDKTPDGEIEVTDDTLKVDASWLGELTNEGFIPGIFAAADKLIVVSASCWKEVKTNSYFIDDAEPLIDAVDRISLRSYGSRVSIIG